MDNLQTMYVEIEAAFNDANGTTIEQAWELSLNKPAIDYFKTLNEPEAAKFILCNPIISNDWAELENSVFPTQSAQMLFLRAREITKEAYLDYFEI